MRKLFLLSVLVPVLYAHAASGQTLLDRIFTANTADSMRYDYVMAIRTGGKVEKQLHGKLLTTPGFYCDSNQQQISVRSGNGYFQADYSSKTVYVGFVKPDTNQRSAQWMQKMRNTLLGIAGSYVKIDSSDADFYKINVHFGIGEISDFKVEANKQTLKMKSFEVIQRFTVEDKKYEYELSAYNVDTDIRADMLSADRFFYINNKHIRPAEAWHTYKVEYL
ncbi:hypothetical protein [Rurimicrobium arvi]|uniref:Outer membrane lipoprotein-sorting protein n=1 Tax=Rurimicrobium arvi TaxID=2049916 RepID=A0ABP8MTF4_9BACT